LLAWLARYRRRRGLAQLSSELALLRLTRRRSWVELLRSGCIALGLLALILGIAGPQWGQGTTETAPGRDLVVVLDLSHSMLAEQPSRQERARRALFDLCDYVQRQGGHRLALVVFAARPLVACPLTHDYDHFRDALAQQDAAHQPPALQPGENSVSGTRIGSALSLAVQIHEQRFAGAQDILLVSDGDDPIRDGEWGQGIAVARNRQVSVHTVGIGDPVEAQPIPLAKLRSDGKEVLTKLMEGPLQEIARRTGGVYIPARTQDARLGQWLEEVIDRRPDLREDGEDHLPAPQPRYGWFLAAALALLTVGLCVGKGRVKRARFAPFRLAVRPTVRAALLLLSLLLISAGPPPSIEELLRQGNEAFAAGRFEVARALYSEAEAWTADPGLVAADKAAALYRLERWREAELHYRRCLGDAEGRRRAGALYDLGNCLLKRWSDEKDIALLDEAVTRFRQARASAAADVELKDKAQHNLELARLLWFKASEVARKADSSGEDNSQDKNSQERKEPENPKSQDTPAPKDKDKTEVGKEPSETQPVPGRGNLPTLPDSETLVPLAPEDTAAHLDRLVERLLRERRAYWQGAVRPRSGVKDW
jgi:Ca-activated chloride channel family protein